MNAPLAHGTDKSHAPDWIDLARRAVVVIAAGSGLYGILSERPILSVAWRAGLVALVGLVAIGAVERALARNRKSTPPGARGGAR